MMDLVRVTNPFEMFANEKIIRSLFQQYFEKKYIDHDETEEEAWQRAVTKVISPDYYFYLIRGDNEFVGFCIGYPWKFPYSVVFWIEKLHIPGRGLEFAETLKLVNQVLGIDEFWGETPDRVFNMYERKLKKSIVTRIKVTRVKL